MVYSVLCLKRSNNIWHTRTQPFTATEPTPDVHSKAPGYDYCPYGIVQQLPLGYSEGLDMDWVVRLRVVDVKDMAAFIVRLQRPRALTAKNLFWLTRENKQIPP